MSFYMGVHMALVYGRVIFSAPQKVAGCPYVYPIWVICGCYMGPICKSHIFV